MSAPRYRQDSRSSELGTGKYQAGMQTTLCATLRGHTARGVCSSPLTAVRTWPAAGVLCDRYGSRRCQATGAGGSEGPGAHLQWPVGSWAAVRQPRSPTPSAGCAVGQLPGQATSRAGAAWRPLSGWRGLGVGGVWSPSSSGPACRGERLLPPITAEDPHYTWVLVQAPGSTFLSAEMRFLSASKTELGCREGPWLRQLERGSWHVCGLGRGS